MNREKAYRHAALALDILIAANFLFIVAMTFHTGLIYREGFNLLEYAFEVFSYLILVRVATLVPWKKLPKLRPVRMAFMVCSGIAFALFIHVLINVNFYSAVQAIIVTRLSFDDATDAEIARDITEDNLWYPQASFVQRIKETVPEDAGIVYFGDQRAHIMSYLLYPRRVYALPEMQVVLNEMVEENWTWSPLVDPFHPPKDPMNPQFQGYPQNRPDEEIQQKLREMIEARDIGWVIYYDSTTPAKNFLKKIEG